MAATQNKLKVASFFVGGGLMDSCFSGLFDIVFANELNPQAARCYKHNIGNHIVVGDLTKLDMDQIPWADLYIGGPPCTCYSSDGANEGEEGDSGKLVWDYFRLIRYKKPTAFLMENVSGLAEYHKSTLQRLVKEYQKAGYIVTAGRMQALDYGAPQSRDRVFLAGFLKEYGKRFVFPAPTKIRRTVRDAIGDLPDPDTGKTVLGTFPNHVASWTSPTPERLYDVIANPRNQRRGMRRLEWDKVSPTITAHIAKDGREFLHPHFDRRLTVRECLRLQGFDDSFVIPNDVKMSQAYRIVGNGVAKPVAEALANALNDQIRKLVVQLDLFDLIAQ